MALQMTNFYGGGGVYSPGAPISRYSPSRRTPQLTPLQQLQQEYQKELDAAKSANEGRYQQLLRELKGSGEQEAKDIRAGWAGRATQGQQDLVSRGLSASTIAPTMAAGYQREENADIGRLNERLRERRLGIIERRSDEYPDLNQLMTLAGMTGSYGGGAGGGGGYTVANYVGAPPGVRAPMGVPASPSATPASSLASLYGALSGLGNYSRSPSLFSRPGEEQYPTYSSAGGTAGGNLFSGLY